MADSAVSFKKYFMVILGLLLFIPPFFKGLYFDKDYLWFVLALLILFTIYYSTQQMGHNKRFLDNLNDYLVLGFVISYGIAVFNAANYNDAFNGFLRVVGYFIVYYLIAHGLRSQNDVSKILNVLYGAGLLVAVVGLGAGLNFYHFAGDITDGRINSTLQYPNTLAAYLTAVFILGIYLALSQKNRILGIIYSLGNYLLLITIFGTQSRGGILVFLFVLPLFLLGPLSKVKLIAWVNTIITIVFAFFVSRNVLADISHQTAFVSMSWVLGGAITVAAFSYGLIFLVEKITVPESIRNLKILVGVIIILILGLVTGLSYDFLPSQFTSRITTINLNDRNVLERFVFYQDAFRAIKDNMIFGAGGGAWRTLFQSYQSYYYIAREVHSYYLQVWLEVGIIGLAFLIGVWFTFIRSTIRLLRSKGNNYEAGILGWTILCSALALGLHGLIDFTFSSGAVAVFLWTLFGLIRSLEAANEDDDNCAAEKARSTYIKKDLVVISALAILLIITTSLNAAVSYSSMASKSLQKNDISNFKRAAGKVNTLNPLSSSFHLYLAQVYAQSGGEQKNDKMMTMALEEADKAVRLNPKEPTIREVRARIYLAMGKVDEGIKEMETALQLQPWYQERWGILTETYYQVGKYYQGVGEKEKAAECFNKVSDMPARISAQLAKLTPEHKKLWVLEPKLQVDSYVSSLAAKADSRLKRI